MLKLLVVEIDDLKDGIAESGFNLSIDNNKVIIDSNYFHSEIDDQIDDYLNQCEESLINWLNEPTQFEFIKQKNKDNELHSDGSFYHNELLSLCYECDLKINKAINFKWCSDLATEE